MKSIERILISAFVHDRHAPLRVADAKTASRASDAARANETESGVSFSAKHGLLVQPVTANFIGLKVAEVEERKVSCTLQFSAQIYRAASEAQFVSTRPSASAEAPWPARWSERQKPRCCSRAYRHG